MKSPSRSRRQNRRFRRPLNSVIGALGAVSLLLSGCVSKPQPPPPPPQPDPVVQMANAMVAIAKVSQASRQAPAIRADTAVIFPVRAQAIALGLLAYRAEAKVWPVNKGELLTFFAKNFAALAPSESDLADLSLALAANGEISFSFPRPSLNAERYTLTPEGTISFSLLSYVEAPAALTTQASPTTTSATPSFLWGDFAARLFVEIPLILLRASAK